MDPRCVEPRKASGLTLDNLGANVRMLPFTPSRCCMTVPTYHIFSGFPDRDASWLEAVEGLGVAHDRMRERAVQAPGAYFVFCPQTHTVLASIDTSRPHKREGQASA